MQMQEQQPKRKLSVTTKIILGMAAAAVILILFILGLQTYQDKWQTFRSKLYPYSLEYNSTRVNYETVLVDNQPTYMERFLVSDAAEDYYLSVISIDPEVDLDEALEAFQSEGDYTFTVDENAVCGAGKYAATKISYTDDSGTTAAEISYYYMPEHGMLVTTCTDEAHREMIGKMLDSFTVTE
ncbi:MAG: hypothetical protein Q4C48_09655 [Lachnospiraceae bacterium]|nr:hypothetical protein [Lachnospiraceae bacterium]